MSNETASADTVSNQTASADTVSNETASADTVSNETASAVTSCQYVLYCQPHSSVSSCFPVTTVSEVTQVPQYPAVFPSQQSLRSPRYLSIELCTCHKQSLVSAASLSIEFLLYQKLPLISAVPCGIELSVCRRQAPPPVPPPPPPPPQHHAITLSTTIPNASRSPLCQLFSCISRAR